MGCCDSYCGKCRGVQTMVVGALVVANSYWSWFAWPMFIGALLVVSGAIKMIKPSCGCNGGCCEGGMCAEEKPSKKKK
jgi:hypothetical protein